MRAALLPAFLLVLGSLVLGATVLRDPIAHAANPFTDVIVGNTASSPVPVAEQNRDANGNLKVHEQGTAAISGTVGLSPSANTVNLGSTDSSALADTAGHLANIDAATGKLAFDGNGNLKTTSQAAAPNPVSDPAACTQGGITAHEFITNDGNKHTLCNADFYITDITAAGMDDALIVWFYLNGNLVYQLDGGSMDGADSYQVDLTHPLHVDDIEATCVNQSTHCAFSLALLGNSTGT